MIRFSICAVTTAVIITVTSFMVVTTAWSIDSIYPLSNILVTKTDQGTCGFVDLAWVPGDVKRSNFLPLQATIKNQKRKVKRASSRKRSALLKKIAKQQRRLKKLRKACQLVSVVLPTPAIVNQNIVPTPLPLPNIGLIPTPAPTPVPVTQIISANLDLRFIEAYHEPISHELIAYFQIENLDARRTSITMAPGDLSLGDGSVKKASALISSLGKIRSFSNQTSYPLTVPFKAPITIGYIFLVSDTPLSIEALAINGNPGLIFRNLPITDSPLARITPFQINFAGVDYTVVSTSFDASDGMLTVAVEFYNSDPARTSLTVSATTITDGFGNESVSPAFTTDNGDRFEFSARSSYPIPIAVNAATVLTFEFPLAADPAEGININFLSIQGLQVSNVPVPYNR